MSLTNFLEVNDIETMNKVLEGFDAVLVGEKNHFFKIIIII